MEAIAFTNRVPTIHEMDLALRCQSGDTGAALELLLARATDDKARAAIGACPATELTALFTSMALGLQEGYKLISLASGRNDINPKP